MLRDNGCFDVFLYACMGRKLKNLKLFSRFVLVVRYRVINFATVKHINETRL